MSGDPQLWQLIRNGDRESLARLFREQYKPLYQFGRRLAADEEVIEDGIQELFLELWQNRERLPAVESVRAYLFGALKRKLYTAFNADTQRADWLIKTEEMPDLAYDALPLEEQPEVELEQRLIRAIGQMTGRQQEVIYLRFYSGMSYEEISQVMQINYQATRNLVYQALKVLRRNLLIISVLVWLQAV